MNRGVNLGRPERVIRIVVGLLLLSLVAFLESKWRWAGLVGLLFVLSGVTGWCPVYAWLAQD